MSELYGLPYPYARCQETFFELMLAGYATDTEPEIITRFDGDRGTKRNTWNGLGGWLGIDEWRTSPLGDGSNGTTSIYYNKMLVWEMQYGGAYPEEVIPFLRRTLAITYTQRVWCGGRGPESHHDGPLSYHNEIEYGDFANFKGEETIFRLDDEKGDTELGYHSYRGGFVMSAAKE